MSDAWVRGASGGHVKICRSFRGQACEAATGLIWAAGWEKVSMNWGICRYMIGLAWLCRSSAGLGLRDYSRH